MAGVGGGAAVAGGWGGTPESGAQRRAWSAQGPGGCAPLQHWHSAPYGGLDGCGPGVLGEAPRNRWSSWVLRGLPALFCSAQGGGGGGGAAPTCTHVQVPPWTSA